MSAPERDAVATGDDFAWLVDRLTVMLPVWGPVLRELPPAEAAKVRDAGRRLVRAIDALTVAAPSEGGRVIQFPGSRE